MIINICDQIREINILYVKIVQWNIQDYYNINEDLKQYFYKFNCNVPYSICDIDYDIINKIQNRYENRLTFDKIPINSGTTALVFKGQLDNKPVAIKVLRKNIYKRIEDGIENINNLLEIFIYIASFFYKVNKNLADLINNNKNILLKQCHLLNEVKNINCFKSKIIASSNIVIPNVYTEFTEFENNIIVMDYLDGCNINDIKDGTKNKNILMYAQTIKKFILNSYLVFKIVHADLHAGNIILLDDNKVGIIDFGIVIEISTKQCNNMFKFFLSLANTDANLLKKSLINLLIKDNNDIEKIKEIVNEPLQFITDDMFAKNKKVCVNKIIKVLKLLLSKIDGNADIKPSISNVLLSLISSLYILEKVDEGNGLPSTIKNIMEFDKFIN